MYIRRQNARSIVDEMKTAIHRDINIMDENGVILASTNPVRQGQVHQGALRIIRENLPSLVIRRDAPEDGVQQGINLPVTIGGRLEGVIGITGDPDEVSAFGDVIKRMTEILLENLQRQEQQALLERAKSLFVENWLFSEEPDWGELETRGRLLGLDINDSYTVALLGLRMIRSRIQDRPGNFCAVIRSRIIVLLCGADRTEAFAAVSGICRDIEGYYGLRTNAGISDSSMAPADIRRCYLEAKTAQTVAAHSTDRRVVFYDQVSLEFIVQSIPPAIRQDLRRLIFSACTPQEEAEFAQTIRAYFAWDGDIQTCAEHLFIHRNTFQYRMDRIKRKTGYNLKAPKDALLLYLTL